MTYSDETLAAKLRALSVAQQSIEITSQWLIFHRRHAKACVATWSREIAKAPPPKRLALIYLANDVIQNSKRKGNEYINEFQLVLTDVFASTLSHVDKDTKGKIKRILNIWKERAIYPRDFLDKLSNSISSPVAQAQPVNESPSPAKLPVPVPTQTLPKELESLANKLIDLKDAQLQKLTAVTNVNALNPIPFTTPHGPGGINVSSEEIENAKRVLSEHIAVLDNEKGIHAAISAEMLKIAGQHDNAVRELTRQQKETQSRIAQLDANDKSSLSHTLGASLDRINMTGLLPQQPGTTEGRLVNPSDFAMLSTVTTGVSLSTVGPSMYSKATSIFGSIDPSVFDTPLMATLGAAVAAGGAMGVTGAIEPNGANGVMGGVAGLGGFGKVVEIGGVAPVVAPHKEAEVGRSDSAIGGGVDATPDDAGVNGGVSNIGGGGGDADSESGSLGVGGGDMSIASMSVDGNADATPTAVGGVLAPAVSETHTAMETESAAKSVAVTSALPLPPLPPTGLNGISASWAEIEGGNALGC